MLEQLTQQLAFVAYFTASKAGKTGLTVTVDVRKTTPAGTTTAPATGAAATEIGGGLYLYTLASASVDAKALYTAVFKTTDTTVDLQQVPSLWVAGLGWVGNCDSPVSGVKAALFPLSGAVNDMAATTTSFVTNLGATDLYTGLVLVPTSGANVGAARFVGSYNTGTKLLTLVSPLPGAPANGDTFVLVSTGRKLADFLATLGGDNRATVSVGTGTGQVNSANGKVPATLAAGDVIGNVAANVTQVAGQTASAAAGVTFPSTISSYMGTDTPGTTTLLARLTAQRGANLDNLDAAVSTRLAGASYSAPDNTSIAGIKTQTDQLTFSTGKVAAQLTAAGDLAQGAADKVWASATRTLTAFGFTVAATVADKTGCSLSASGLDAVLVEAGLNARQALSVIASATAGVLAGAAGTSITIAAAGVPATGRIAATVDGSGNRTAVTLTPPA